MTHQTDFKLFPRLCDTLLSINVLVQKVKKYQFIHRDSQASTEKLDWSSWFRALCKSIANIIIWTSTLTNAQCHFTCVLTLCCFSWKLAKKPSVIDSKLRSPSFSYQIFTMQICCVQRHQPLAQKRTSVCRNHLFSFIPYKWSLWEWRRR